MNRFGVLGAAAVWGCGGVCHSDVFTGVSASRVREIAGYLAKAKNMSARSKDTAPITREHSGPEGGEQRLKELAELDLDAGREAAYFAALNVLVVARHHLGSLDKVTRIVRLGVSVATSGDARDQPKVADAASELLQDVFEKKKILAAWRTASRRVDSDDDKGGPELGDPESFNRVRERRYPL